MIKYTLIQFIRNFRRNKTTFLVNLISLSTGLTCAILIFMWVNDELSMDKFHENIDRLYQVMQNQPYPDGIETWDYTTALLRQAMLNEFPEIEYAVSTNNSYNKTQGLVSVNDINIEITCNYVSNDFFRVFSFPLLQGDENQVLKDKNGALITKGLANKLFGTTHNLIGKSFEWEGIGSGTYYITGILDKIPHNSRMQFEVLFNYDVLLNKLSWLNQWNGDGAETYIVLKEGVNVEHFETKIANFLKTKAGRKQTLFLQKYSDRYLNGKFENGKVAGGRIDYVILFSIIAVFILFIACVNFINLTTAKASVKMKEVGIKKTVGANRKTLIFQFVSESMIMTFLSLIIAVALIVLLLPVFNQLSSKQLGLSVNTGFILWVFGAAMISGFISGIYPALYISGFKPASILKSSILKSSFEELWIRQGLVVFQFSTSIILIIGFLMVNKQVEFVQTKNLGYNRDNILCFLRKGVNDNDETFMSELRKIPGIVSATNFWGNLAENKNIGMIPSWPGQTNQQKISVPKLEVGYDFFETYGIEFIEGRDFLRSRNKRNSMIVNEAAVKYMGLENPIGTILKRWYGESLIIGVVKDFQLNSVHTKIKPCFIRYSPTGTEVNVKIQSGTEVATIKRLKDFYEKYHPKYSFEFSFLDQNYQSLYDSEMRIATLSKYFAGIAILISCLGLFVLAAYTAERKTKEIGVRKVNGASIVDVLVMLNAGFVKWVLLAFVIACPIAYIAIKKWLESFAYRTEITWDIFFATGGIALLVAISTICWQSWRAANRNPVEALRYE